jgi:hypothetical protein
MRRPREVRAEFRERFLKPAHLAKGFNKKEEYFKSIEDKLLQLYLAQSFNLGSHAVDFFGNIMKNTPIQSIHYVSKVMILLAVRRLRRAGWTVNKETLEVTWK